MYARLVLRASPARRYKFRILESPSCIDLLGVWGGGRGEYVRSVSLASALLEGELEMRLALFLQSLT